MSVLDRINNGPKYFVLTFVLCGVIAGIVLAVIAVYIVRRHTHSREKLAQLASTTDSAEASKDYQVKTLFFFSPYMYIYKLNNTHIVR